MPPSIHYQVPGDGDSSEPPGHGGHTTASACTHRRNARRGAAAAHRGSSPGRPSSATSTARSRPIVAPRRRRPGARARPRVLLGAGSRAATRCVACISGRSGGRRPAPRGRGRDRLRRLPRGRAARARRHHGRVLDPGVRELGRPRARASRRERDTRELRDACACGSRTRARSWPSTGAARPTRTALARARGQIAQRGRGGGPARSTGAARCSRCGRRCRSTRASAVRELVAPLPVRAALFAGDDATDLDAFDALDELVAEGALDARRAGGRALGRGPGGDRRAGGPGRGRRATASSAVLADARGGRDALPRLPADGGAAVRRQRRRCWPSCRSWAPRAKDDQHAASTWRSAGGCVATLTGLCGWGGG